MTSGVSIRAMALLLLALPAAGAAQAQSGAQATRQFDVPAGALGPSLARLGRQAGAIIAADPALVRSLQTSGVQGEKSLDAALQVLLADTGLVAQPDGRGGYRIVAGPAAAKAPPVRATSVPLPPALESEDPGEAIVVVGALTNVDITRHEMDTRQANDLTDIFRQVPSVNVGGALGIAQKIYVRGLEDNMLNVTVDGAPQHGTLFHHIGRVSIEPELLQTVEVQAGAGEATSGFGAIGGAIRFRTRDADDLLRPGQSFGALAKAGWFSNTGYKLTGIVYGKLFGDVGAIASYTHVKRENVKDGGGEELLGTAAKQSLGFAKVGGELGGGHRFSASYEQRDETASFGQRPNWPVVVGERLFPAKGKRQTAIGNYGYDAVAGVGLEATGYWTKSRFNQDRYDRWGLYGATIRSWGFDLRGRVQRADHDLVVGAEYRNDQVVSEYLEDVSVWGDWAWDASIGRFEERGDVMGVYVQDHWTPMEQLTLSFGARYDAYSLRQVTYRNATSSQGLSFNGGLRYELLDGLNLWGSYAEAMRGKEIGDAFTLEKRPGRLSLQPGLKPERVDNIEAGVSFERSGFRASAVYYDMTINDVIFDQIGAGPAPEAANYYENIGRFHSKGVELRAGYTTGPFSIDGYFNHYTSRINGWPVEGYEHIGLGNSVGDNWNISAGYRPSEKFSLEANLTHFNSLDNIEVLERNVEIGWIDKTQFVDKPGYTVVDIFGRWQPLQDDRITLLAGVYNLFDARYRAHASVADYTHIPDYEGVVGIREPGRDIRLTVSFRY